MRYAKSDFTAGELAPELYGRTETEEYGYGCKVLKNALPLPTGGFCNRPGTKLIALVKNTGTAWRLESFVFSSALEDKYVLEFGHQYIRFYKNDAQVTIAGSPYEIATPWTSAQIKDLKFVQSADILIITHQRHQPRVLTRYDDTNWTLTAYEYLDGPYRLENATDLTITPDGISGDNVKLTAGDAIFSNLTGYTHSNGRCLFRINHWLPAQKVSFAKSSTDTPATGASTGIKCGGTWRIFTHGTWTGTFQIEVSDDGGTTWTASRVFASVDDNNPNTYTTEDFSKQFLVRVNITDLTSGSVTVDLSADPFEWTGVALITQVPYGGGGSSMMYNTAKATILETLGSTNATKVWAEGAWSDYRGYPACVAFIQDRLTFGGSPSEPSGVWQSKAGNYYSFGREFPLKDDDGISINLPSRKLNPVKNLIQLNDLVATTSEGISTIEPGQSGVMTPTTVVPKIHDLAGASGITPAVINNRIVYAQEFGKIIRDSGYDFATDGYQGINLNFMSKHIFRRSSAVQMAYQREPWQTLWIVRSDGKLVSLTYTKQLEKYGWAVHTTCRGNRYFWETADEWKEGGKFLSVCTVPGSDQDDVWVIVEREGATTIRTVEKFYNRETSSDPAQQKYLDCCYEYDAPVVVSGFSSDMPTIVTTATAHGFIENDEVEFTGLRGIDEIEALNGKRFVVKNVDATHFNLYLDAEPIGLEVGVTANAGAVVRKVISAIAGATALKNMLYFDEDYNASGVVSVLTNGCAGTIADVVDNTGAAPLPCSASVVLAGLPYVSECETMNIEFNTTSGSTKGKLKSTNEVSLYLYETYGGKVGTSRDDMQELTDDNGSALHHQMDDDGEPTGVPPELYTGEFKQAINSGSKMVMSFIIRQEEPYPITVLSIDAEVDIT